MANETPAPNEEDDLFNFDALFKSAPKVEPPPATPVATAVPSVPAKTVAAPSVPAAETHAEATAAHAPVEAPRKPAPPRLPPGVLMPMGAGSQGAPASQLPLVKPVSVTREPQPQVEVAPAEPRAARFSLRSRPGRITITALVAATLLNLALAGVVWRSLSGMGQTLREVGDHVARAGDAVPIDVTPPVHPVVTPSVPAPSEAELALEQAAEDVRQGEFERARVRLYSLLAVLDRFEPNLRTNLATRAQVLAADSYREQADQLDRSTAGAPGFLSRAAEEQR